ncbi:NAD(P)-dependent oxidoreductase [Bacillus sp. Marseille-Q3570]|uniref:NAD-dependent epimerase/dehydratase family protein n=1 Tax=Bacillus sp. Marseille-Q3570 TaxID=2963522 RepID=UPI0021B74530|nr:NAD-dependent epimerase/dehydratase family protein [Bacillus sp. Marseille-Q3570]
MRIDEKRILITGASGFTGIHAVNSAVRMGMQVTCISRNPILHPYSKNIACDLTKYSEIDKTVKEIKPDYVLHLAGFNNADHSWKSPLQCMESNLLGTLNLLEALRIHVSDSRTLIIGSALQYSLCNHERPPHPYSLSKTFQILLSKEWKTLFSMDIALAKPTNLIGPGNSAGICAKVAKKIVAAEQQEEAIHVHLHNSKAQCDFVDVRDAVEAYLLILTSKSKDGQFDIGSGHSRTLEELMSHFAKATPRRIQVTKDHSIESPPIKVDLEAIHSLGWQPKYSLQNSLEDTISFYKSKQ